MASGPQAHQVAAELTLAGKPPIAGDGREEGRVEVRREGTLSEGQLLHAGRDVPLPLFYDGPQHQARTLTNNNNNNI